jgi:hypothetical protein
MTKSHKQRMWRLRCLMQRQLQGRLSSKNIGEIRKIFTHSFNVEETDLASAILTAYGESVEQVA